MAAASDTRADAELSELAQKIDTLLAVAAVIAAVSIELARALISEHSWRKASTAVAAAAAEDCRHLAMTAWASVKLLVSNALVMQACSELLISTSLFRSFSTGPASSGGRDDIERLLGHDITGPQAQPDIHPGREERAGYRTVGRWGCA
jgi:hypothetical protein